MKYLLFLLSFPVYAWQGHDGKDGLSYNYLPEVPIHYNLNQKFEFGAGLAGSTDSRVSVTGAIGAAFPLCSECFTASGYMKIKTNGKGSEGSIGITWEPGW